MSSISWVDSSGSATLSNLKPVPSDRFTSWSPDAMPVGPEVTGLGTGRISRFEFRKDYIVSFEIRGIPGSEMMKMLRLKLHLMGGGLVTVTTANILASTYATCSLAPGTIPGINFSDKTRLLYTLSVTLRAVTGLSGGGASFSPGLIADIDPVALIGTLASGDYTGYCPDTTGNSNHATQATSALYMRYLDGVLNGRPVLESYGGYNGAAGGRLLTPVLRKPEDGMTVFLVARRNGVHMEHTTFGWIGYNWTELWIRETHNVTGYPDNNHVQWVNAIAAGTPNGAINGLSTDWFIWAIRVIATSNARTFYNDVPNPEGVFGLNPTAAATAHELAIGGGQVQIARALVFDTSLVDADMTNTFGILSDVYGIAI